MRAQYELFPTKGKRWAFRLRAANGRIVGPSQTYASKRNARDGIEAHNAAAFGAADQAWMRGTPRIVEVTK
jgi:uncharacterized protein YegP (UPF0339 family)